MKNVLIIIVFRIVKLFKRHFFKLNVSNETFVYMSILKVCFHR